MVIRFRSNKTKLKKHKDKLDIKYKKRKISKQAFLKVNTTSNIFHWYLVNKKS